MFNVHTFAFRFDMNHLKADFGNYMKNDTHCFLYHISADLRTARH